MTIHAPNPAAVSSLQEWQEDAYLSDLHDKKVRYAEFRAMACATLTKARQIKELADDAVCLSYLDGTGEDLPNIISWLEELSTAELSEVGE